MCCDHSDGPGGRGHAFWGRATCYPSVAIEAKYDSNIFLQQSNETDSWVTTISPRALYVLEGEFRRFSIAAGLSKGIYRSSSDDNYLDGDLSLQADFTPGDRLSMTLGAGYLETHDPRGSGDSEGATATAFDHPDEYGKWDIHGRLGFGLKELYAPRLSVEVGHSDTGYQNNRARTASRDFSENRLLGNFSFMVAPNTSIELDGRVYDLDYDTADSDNRKYKLLAGVSWDATYQTTGSFKVGRQKADFKSSADRTTSAWEVGVDWRPLSYSTVSFTSSKDIIDSTGGGGGNATANSTSRLTWNHAWKSYLTTSAYYQFTDEEYKGTTREDETKTLGVSASYGMREWLRLSAGLLHTEKRSNSAGLDYDDNIISVSAEVGL